MNSLAMTRRAATFGPLAALAPLAAVAPRDALQRILDALGENDRWWNATPEWDDAAEQRFIGVFRNLQADMQKTSPTTYESAVDGLRYLVKVAEKFDIFDREEEETLFLNCVAFLAGRRAPQGWIGDRR